MSEKPLENETQAPEPGDPTAAAPADALASEIPPSDLAAELEAAKDRGLRLQAELENTRRRHQRELEERRRYANLELMRELLPVLDNIDRAIEAAADHADATGLLAGVQLVRDQLNATMAQFHCTRIDALGQTFDPNLHEAISQLPSSDHPAGTIITVTQQGYQLHDRIVRSPQVIIAAASDASPSGGSPDSPETPEA